MLVCTRLEHRRIKTHPLYFPSMLVLFSIYDIEAWESKRTASVMLLLYKIIPFLNCLRQNVPFPVFEAIQRLHYIHILQNIVQIRQHLQLPLWHNVSLLICFSPSIRHPFPASVHSPVVSSALSTLASKWDLPVFTLPFNILVCLHVAATGAHHPYFAQVQPSYTGKHVYDATENLTYFLFPSTSEGYNSSNTPTKLHHPKPQCLSGNGGKVTGKVLNCSNCIKCK